MTLLETGHINKGEYLYRITLNTNIKISVKINVVTVFVLITTGLDQIQD